MPAPHLAIANPVVDKAGIMTKPWVLWCQFLAALFKGSPGTAFEMWGEGDPEGVIAGPVSSKFNRTDGTPGATFYVKESGTGTTGWAAK